MSYGAETQANALLTALLLNDDIPIPEVDLSGTEYEIPGGVNNPIYTQIPKLTTEDLTTRVVGGTGTFDALMASFSAHLKAEYDKGRITGADYTKAYTDLSAVALTGAVQYLLGRDQAYWAGVLAQMQAITGKVALITAKVQLASIQLQAHTARANYGLTKMKLSSEDAAYGQAKFTNDQLLPAQLTLIKEQVETARAATLDNRTDGVVVTGSVGKQKALYSQQIISYQRDAEVKATKLFTDAWITQKTIDEGLLPPDNFANTSLNAILATLKSNNNLG